MHATPLCKQRLGRRNRFRGAQRDRCLDQSADVTGVRSAVQSSDGGARREQARHRRVAVVEDGAIAVDHDAAHGVGDRGANRQSVERRDPDRPRPIAVAAPRRRKRVQRAGVDGSVVRADEFFQLRRRDADQSGEFRNRAGAMQRAARFRQQRIGRLRMAAAGRSVPDRLVEDDAGAERIGQAGHGIG